ncbi:MAG: hypothetical protein Q8879_01855, partial [Candidatus Phytoplasma australasiaticum]|nr:hypothetical protein [Candidatus Phytoplasma australasiaticum]
YLVNTSHVLPLKRSISSYFSVFFHLCIYSGPLLRWFIYHLNLGIRIEDNIIVKRKGNINLSSNIPKEIKEIESLIK